MSTLGAELTAVVQGGVEIVKRAGRTLTVCTADAFAISDGKEKVVATMLATIMAVPITPAK
jgi:hypothetical protein